MFSLQPPRHISTLPEVPVRCVAVIGPESGANRTLGHEWSLFAAIPVGFSRAMVW
jgi:hypothetical protein